MENLQEMTEKICQLKGELVALQTVIDALFRALPPHVVKEVAAQHAEAVEIARVTLLNSERVGEFVISSFDLHAQNTSSMLRDRLKTP